MLRESDDSRWRLEGRDQGPRHSLKGGAATVARVALVAAMGLVPAGCVYAEGAREMDTGSGELRSDDEAFALVETTLVLRQVDYQPAIYYDPGDPLPRLDQDRVGWDRVVEVEHRAVVLRTQYVELTVLPRMGRVYRMVHRPTGHDVLWRNDIVRPGGGNNATGWWLWIGGIEYTLPGDEHGTTFALPWTYCVLEDSPHRKAVRMEVTEPTTGLEERLDLSVYPGRADFETDIRIHNPGQDTARFAHWVNPMWTPGGRNELTDRTEFIVPTERILIEERWQKNLGPSPQPWRGNPLRFIENWRMGDIMADELTAGFYSAYSHDEEEGVVRVFDPLATPGMDMWTYGFHPDGIPMGSGAANKGYAEMWGGTVERFPHQRRPLGPGASLQWTEWMYAYQSTRGLSFAGRDLAAHSRLSPEGAELEIALCPSRRLEAAVLEVRSSGRTLVRRRFGAAPESPWKTTVALEGQARDILVRVEENGAELGRWHCAPAER